MTIREIISSLLDHADIVEQEAINYGDDTALQEA